MSEILPAGSDSVARAAAILRAGGLVAFPTETVYGLGGDATSDRVVAAIYRAKGRPAGNPLIVHVPDQAAAERYACFDPPARKLAARFWPGPLTLVLPRRPGSPLSPRVSAGLTTVALRVPAHEVALALLRECALPLAAPSANPAGRVSPTTARHVAEGLGGRVALILDGGSCRVGVESTVLDLSGPEPLLLRPGGLARETIEAAIGPLGAPVAGAPARSPGLIGAHYAPGLPVRINLQAAPPGWALLGFGPAPAADANLSPSGDLVEAAANLFALLRALDRAEFAGIAVMPVPETGLGLAINDRLRRASVVPETPVTPTRANTRG